MDNAKSFINWGFAPSNSTNFDNPFILGGKKLFIGDSKDIEYEIYYNYYGMMPRWGNYYSGLPDGPFYGFEINLSSPEIDTTDEILFQESDFKDMVDYYEQSIGELGDYSGGDEYDFDGFGRDVEHDFNLGIGRGRGMGDVLLHFLPKSFSRAQGEWAKI